MNRAIYEKSAVKLGTVKEAQERYRLGRSKLMEIAENEGAVRRFGRSVRVDVSVLDRAIANY